MPRNFRPLLISTLALLHGRSQKQIGAAAGIPQKRVSQLLRGEEIEDEPFNRLVAATSNQPAEVSIVTMCLESLAGLEQNGDLTAAERVEVELGVQKIADLVRRVMKESVLRSRDAPGLDRYPQAAGLEPARWHAAMLFRTLQELPEPSQWVVVRAAREFQSWALAERLCEESEAQACRDRERAAFLARLAQQVARRVRGPKGWVRRIRAFAATHAAHVLWVTGRLNAAAALVKKARLLWDAGSDPEGVLDPGRLLDLEASLCRAQHRFEDALALLDQARGVSRRPLQILINKGFTLEVMGEYERALETLLEAKALPEVEADPRLRNLLDGNLALDFCHAGRFAEAAEVTQQMREAAAGRGDGIGLLLVLCLDGRIAAGLGRTGEALSLLAQARQAFEALEMTYEVALARLEEAALLLDEGRTAEVKALTRGLLAVFEAKEVHPEALAALRLFHEAAGREAATPELARRVLRHLFRTRYDQGPGFEP